MTFSSLLKLLSLQAISKAYPNQVALIDHALVEITSATQEKFGHYQLNCAMKLTKLVGEPPRQIAEKIVSHLNLLKEAEAVFAQIEIAGPGFINFTLHQDFINQQLMNQLQDPRLGVPALNKPLKVIIDFSSPNIAKEMHVGHLRSTIIGDCLARILSFVGHEVLPLNHVGDWGTQFGMLIAHLKTVLPEITETSTPSVDLGDLVSWYRAAKQRFDEDAEFKKRAQQEVVALQSGQESSRRAWEHICAISRKAYQTIYDLLGIKLFERGESFYNPFLAPLIKELDEKNLLSLSDGAKCMYLEGFTNREGDKLPLILQKSDGGYNYATTDMAALRHRVQTEKGNWLIYITDAGQSLHFQMVFAAAKKAEFYVPEQVRVDHVPFGLVLKADGKKFKTRSGDTERLIDLLQTAIDKAKQKLLEHDPDISETELEFSSKILGLNAVKYADLSCNRISDYIFSYEKMLKFEGNTAAFLLYAYVRIRSIQRKININIAELLITPSILSLEEPIEQSLAILVCQFGEILESVIQDLMPNRLTDYLYRLAEKFHVFFHQCRVEGSPKQNSRLILCESVANVLQQGLKLLGLQPLERM